MKPKHLFTNIFLDSGDPTETTKAKELLGFLDGQTTNPSLVAKNPMARARFEQEGGFPQEELLNFYTDIVQEISALIPQGSVSIEVYADKTTTAEAMLQQGRKMFSWIDNAHIKFPTNKEGLKAAHKAVKEGMRVNMTLCFTQEQAAAVHAATRGANEGQVFVSPFDGRLDDIQKSGMSLIENVQRMYQEQNSHVKVLMASVRDLDHLLHGIELRVDIITLPFTILQTWAEKGMPIPGATMTHIDDLRGLERFEYRELDLNKNWQDFKISHSLLDKGIARFAADWNKLVK